MGPKKKSSKRGGSKPVFRPQAKGQGSTGRISPLLEDAIAQMNVGKYGRASAALKKVLAIEEDHPEALRLFATLHLKLGSLMAAKTSFEALARKAMKNKDYRLAESLLREYLAVAPRYIPFLELLGKALEANGHFMAAVAEYGRAIEIFVEEGDPELKTKGMELYETMKVIGAESQLTQKLSSLFEESMSATEAPALQDEILASQVPSEQDRTGQTESPSPLIHRPSDEGAPAAFPWTPTDEPDISSLAVGEVGLESSAVPLGAAGEIESPSEEISQKMEARGVDSTPLLGPWEPEEQSESSLEGVFVEKSESSFLEQSMTLPKPTVAPLPWEEGGFEESIEKDRSQDFPAFTDEPVGQEPLSQGEPVEEPLIAVEDQERSSSEALTEELLIPNMGKPAPWDRPTPSSEESIDPLPWEDTVEISSADAEQRQAPDVLSQDTPDFLESQALSPDPEPTDSGFSFSSVEKDSSSFAAFPWENQVDSPDPSISAGLLSSEIESTDSHAATEDREPTGPSVEAASSELVEDLEVQEDLAVVDASPSHEPVDGEASRPLPDGTEVEEIELLTPQALESSETQEPSPPEPEVIVSSAEESSILEGISGPVGNITEDLPQAMDIEKSPGDLDSILDVDRGHLGDHPESGTEEVEEKPIEQAAAEAVASLTGDPESSTEITEGGFGIETPLSSFGQTGTLELKELPEERGSQAEEESLAQAATEALGRFDRGVDSEVSLPEEPQVLSEFSEEVLMGIDMPLEVGLSDELPSDPLEDVSPPLEEPSLPPIFEDMRDSVPQVEEAPVDSFPILDGDSDDVQPDEVPAQPEPEEEGEVVEPVAADRPLPLSPWDPQDDVVQEPSFSEVQFDEHPNVEEPVQESSGISASIQFASSEESRDFETVDTSVASSLGGQSGGALRAGSDIDIVHPESESYPLQEQEEEAEESGPKGSSRKVRSLGPTWAVAQSQEGLSEKVEHKPLFPTVHKLRYKVKRFTSGVISAVRTVSILSLLASLGIGLLGLLTVGIISIIWVAVEERPNEPFHNMMKGPSLAKLDSNRNGYHVLGQLGLSSTLYPIGFQQQDTGDKGGTEKPASSLWASAAFQTIEGWYRVSDPIAEFQAQSSQIRAWSSQFGADLSKYHQWSGKSFEDIGYRSIEGPDEKHIVAVHQLFIAEGFSGSMTRGVDRLAKDLEEWRYALGQAKTLRIKVLALEIVQDDLVILSALLGNPLVDRNLLPTLTQLGRPISHNERSLRWPMQNQFVLEVDQVNSYMKSQRFPDRPWYQKAMTFLPLPQQKIFNAHAVFYEKLIKHDASLHLEGDPRTGIPKRYPLAHTPAESLADYFNNPVDNFVMTKAKVDWRDITGRFIELEARLRLTSLQARIRRPPEVRDPITRIASAGQDYFDPFTGYTMLLNASKTRLYSVGSDGVDDDGDLDHDVAVPLFRR